jgi:hypothetical protein
MSYVEENFLKEVFLKLLSRTLKKILLRYFFEVFEDS